jgi:hypothetical protein
MAWFIMAREIADAAGRGVGRWRLTATSDDPVSGPFGLCDHEHSSAAEASDCPDAVDAASRY